MKAWIIVGVDFDMDDADALEGFIKEMGEQYQDFYLRDWKLLKAKQEVHLKINGVDAGQIITPEKAKEFIDIGFYFSLGDVTTFTNNYDEAIKAVSLEKITLETDAPYVAPVPFRGKRNEPAYISYVAGAVAKILGVSKDEITEKTYENTIKIFQNV